MEGSRLSAEIGINFLFSNFRVFERMSSEDQKAEFVSRAKLPEQAQRCHSAGKYYFLVLLPRCREFQEFCGNNYQTLNDLFRKKTSNLLVIYYETSLEN